MARRYVHYLVDEIVVNGADVRIRGNTTAFLNTLAQKNNVRTGNSPVLTLGHDWLPVSRSQRNLAYGWHVMPVFSNPCDRKVIYTLPLPNDQEKPVPVSPLLLALAFRRMLDAGEVKSQSELAKKVGLTRARITQLLNLLKLPEAIIQNLASFDAENQVVFCNERRLRPITQLQSKKEQIRAFRKLQGVASSSSEST